MPLIRLARDKRGLDTFYLLHHRSDGRGGTRLRVLYFSAAPQGLSFGRAWLDPATQRTLERQHPDVDFDWPALLRELEQRRLPVVVEAQARRTRPAAKAERRPPASEVPVDRAATPKRKRRRGSGSPGSPSGAPTGTPSQGDTPSGASESPPAAQVNEPRTPPIIEP